MSTTAQALVDQARVRHAAFLDVAMPDGAVLLYLNQRQRKLLLQYGRQVEALLNVSITIATVISGSLIGVDALGAPYIVTTTGTGYALQVDGSGVPYVDTTQPPIAVDPFGEDGDSPGIPLPINFVRLTHITATLSGGQVVPIEIVAESQRGHAVRTGLAAFVAGNRLIPIRATTGAPLRADWWSDVTAIGLSYVALAEVTALGDLIALPPVLEEALVAGLAELLAMSSDRMSPALQRQFTESARLAERELETAGNEMLGDASTDMVTYRG